MLTSNVLKSEKFHIKFPSLEKSTSDCQTQ